MRLCTAEATLVILDRALCVPHLEEQTFGGQKLDTQADHFARLRGIHSAVSEVSVQLTRSIAPSAFSSVSSGKEATTRYHPPRKGYFQARIHRLDFERH